MFFVLIFYTDVSVDLGVGKIVEELVLTLASTVVGYKTVRLTPDCHY